MINLGGDATTLEVQGADELAVYRATVEEAGKQVRSGHARYFCRQCGTHVYAIHDRWPELVHPVVSAIDSQLPVPPAQVHAMLGSKASWVPDEVRDGDEAYDGYPAKSLADWHRDHGFEDS